MSYILSIETATKVSSVALHKEGDLLGQKINQIEHSHAESIGGAIESLLEEAGLRLSNLSAVAVSKGPGSYTGLRIGVSIAKGICYGSSIPLIGIESLKAMALEVKTKYTTGEELLCPMIDARRMEVYCQIFNNALKAQNEISAEIIDENSLLDWVSDKGVLYFGDGAYKCKTIFTHPNFKFVKDIYPKAEFIGKLAWQQFQEKKFENLAYFEPFYLKEFIAKSPSGKNLV